MQSHAQNHFVRLYTAGKPLPEKVKESGDGYTLSGKPLDPNAASLRKYTRGPNKVYVSYMQFIYNPWLI